MDFENFIMKRNIKLFDKIKATKTLLFAFLSGTSIPKIFFVIMKRVLNLESEGFFEHNI